MVIRTQFLVFVLGCPGTKTDPFPSAPCQSPSCIRHLIDAHLNFIFEDEKDVVEGGVLLINVVI